MFFLGVDLLSPYSVVTIAFVRSTCRVDIKLVNPSSNITIDSFKIISCYNQRCCKEGCCPRDINLNIVGIVCLVLFLIVLAERLCHWYCRGGPEPSNNSEGNYLTTPTNRFDYACNVGHPTFGTNFVELHIQPLHQENELPTYKQDLDCDATSNTPAIKKFS